MIEICEIIVRVFRYKSSKHKDSAGHSHPGPEHGARQAMLTIRASDGTEGHAFGSSQALRPHLVKGYLETVLLKQDPFERERLWQELHHWQRGSGDQLTERTIALADMALHDLVGRYLGIPTYKLLGGARDKIPAYASTMCGDELDGGLATPEDYARYAEWLIGRGYKAIKLHTWMPPVSWAPDVKQDLRACAAVREAVGPDTPLMLDAFHWYDRISALDLGRGLEKLGFYWFEEPMDEQSMSSYAWLSGQLDIPVIGPESAGGKYFNRAEWIKAGACDIMRSGVVDVGGIGACIKTANVAEAFGMNCEIHSPGAGSLAVLGAIKNARWYERGMLHPFIDYYAPPAYLNTIIDPMDADGYVAMPNRPGLGEDINFDYINDNLVHLD